MPLSFIHTVSQPEIFTFGKIEIGNVKRFDAVIKKHLFQAHQTVLLYHVHMFTVRFLLQNLRKSI